MTTPSTLRPLYRILPLFFLAASLLLIGAIPQGSGLQGRAEGDSTESGEEEYPDYISDAVPPSYEPAELASNVKYPKLARENGIEGRVILHVYLSKEGAIDKITVLRAEPEDGEIRDLFVAAAIEGVRKTKFTPAMMNGVGINYRMPVAVRFELR